MCDNYLPDLELAHTLVSNEFTLVGTVQMNKKFLPPAFRTNMSKPKGSALFGFRDNTTLASFVQKKRV